ncbi:DUF1254 domain-containing protein [bacterium]|nr:DUF1254 domain-containing protein [bacterium]
MTLTYEQAREKARRVSVFGLPLVVTYVTSLGGDYRGLRHLRAFPDDTQHQVVRMNMDTLYSTGFTQLAVTPYVAHLPRVDDRYWLFPIMDAYTEVVASIGTRTPERAEGDYLLLYRDDPVPSGYEGHRVIRLATSLNSVLLRIETRGRQDYAHVYGLQDHFSLAPLHPERLRPVPAAGEPPAQFVDRVEPRAFFGLLASLVRDNPIPDERVLADFIDLGLDEDFSFNVDALADDVRRGVSDGFSLGRAQVLSAASADDGRRGVTRRGWTTILSGVGRYGGDYLRRAATAYGGWGANVPEDSVYVTARTDAEGAPLYSDDSFRLHVDADGFPHASHFWSITLYDPLYPTPNPIGRYGVNSFDVDAGRVELGADGSLDLYLCRDAPRDGHARRNWLPTPAHGASFMLALRIYSPDAMTLAGEWDPPVIERLGRGAPVRP